VSGVAATLRKRTVNVVVGGPVAVALALRWANHVHPSLGLACADAAASLVCALLFVAVILVQVYCPGPINLHRIQGAIAVYLLLASAWSLAYQLVALSNPAAFVYPAAADPHHLHTRLLYFSVATLTTVGYGDITPLSPTARSLAALEALVGQLFPAILLARLVALEIYYHQRREH
jgi:hypothetical protein